MIVLFILLLTVVSVKPFQCTGFDPVFDSTRQLTKTALFEAHKSGSNIISQSLVEHQTFPLDFAEHIHSHSHTHTHSHSHSHSHSHPQIRLKSSPNTLSPFRLDKVSLEEGSLLAKKQSINLDYVTWLNTDSLLYIFRNTSNLPLQGAQPFGGWEDPNCLLRGHFAGHWLSASALAANATGNLTIRQHALYVVTELAKCQAANEVLYGLGYLSGFPSSQFDDLENLVPYPKQWSPYYTIHKIFAGLRDHYIFLGNPVALQIMEGMASYFLIRIRNVFAKGTIALWHAIMNQEFGGMNEIGYDLYDFTKNSTYLELAHLFDKPCWLGPLSMDDGDQLDTMHANAHEPIVIGAARRYELLNDEIYSTMTANFQHHLTEDHAYATGNGNHGEYWSVPGRLGDTLDGDTQESCTSYNLLKIDRHLLSWTNAVEYANHYEKLFFNGILSTQNPTMFGSMIYMLPISTINGTSKGWGDPIYSMTCCYGTGIETHAKLMDTLYMHQDIDTFSGVPTLVVIQYHSSNVTYDTVSNWGEKSFTVQQSTFWDDIKLTLKSTFSILSVPESQVTLSLRVPSWTTTDASFSINGNADPLPNGTPNSWSNITRMWSIGDTLTATFPFSSIRFELITDDRAMYNSTAAVIAGPFVLVSPSIQGSALFGNINTPSEWIQPISSTIRSSTISLLAGGDSPGMYVTHDESGSNFNVNVRVVDINRDAADSTFISTGGINGAQSTISIESVNYPSFFICAKQTAIGSPFLVLDPKNLKNQVTNDDCTFVPHTPGLSGIPNTTSFELASAPGSYLSWFGGGTGVTVQKLQDGPLFANMTTFDTSVSPLWEFPPFSFIATTSDTARNANGARDYLLFPIAHAVYETYVTYFQIS